MNSKVDHVFHVWINSEANRLTQWQKQNPSGETVTETRRGKTVETPVPTKPPSDYIDPHGRGLYEFKSAMQHLVPSWGKEPKRPWLARTIGENRRKELPLVHQQCSHSTPEPLAENFHQCSLGQKLNDCPILKRLRETFDQERNRSPYYREITDEDVDEVAAQVCVWHLLMGSDGFTDWNEGAFQSVSDRKFWNRVYDNLQQRDEPPSGS